MNIQRYNGIIQNYLLSSGEVAGGSNKVMMDFFNNTGSGIDILIMGLWIAPKTDVAVTGVVAARFDLFRTSSKGTGGTSESRDGPAANVLNI